jgi:hypothetical protein
MGFSYDAYANGQAPSLPRVFVDGTLQDYVARYEGGTWTWYPDNGDGSGGGGSIEPPPPALVCPAVVAQSQALDCSGSVTFAPNGCGATGAGWLVPETPYEDISFTPACDTHDACYSTIGLSRLQCDQNFGAEASAICESGESRTQFRSEGIDLGLFGNQLNAYEAEKVIQCQGFALVYQGAAMALGLNPFLAGQKGAQCRALKELSNENGCGL